MELDKIQWYAYKHIDKSIHVKRFFDFKDLDEAWESTFVDVVTGPFTASSVEEAKGIATKRFTEK